MSKPLRFSTLHGSISKNELYKKIKELEVHYKLLLERKIDPLLIIGGIAGVGKTFLLRKACWEHHIRFEPVAPKNAHVFVELLYRHRDDPLLVIDDAKTGFASAPETAELVKSAFGPEPRQVVWDVKNAGKKGNPPRTFKVKTSLVWLSNFDTTDNMDAIHKESRENFNAILSRSGESFYVDAPDQDVYRYCIWLATHGELWKKNKLLLSRETTEKAIDWFTQHRNELKELSPRSLYTIGKDYHNIKDPKELELWLKKRLVEKGRELPRKIDGFGPLKLVKPGEWVEDIKSDAAFERGATD